MGICVSVKMLKGFIEEMQEFSTVMMQDSTREYKVVTDNNILEVCEFFNTHSSAKIIICLKADKYNYRDIIRFYHDNRCEFHNVIVGDRHIKNSFISILKASEWGKKPIVIGGCE